MLELAVKNFSIGHGLGVTSWKGCGWNCVRGILVNCVFINKKVRNNAFRLFTI